MHIEAKAAPKDLQSMKDSATKFDRMNKISCNITIKVEYQWESITQEG